MASKDGSKLRADLDNFTGTEQYHRQPLYRNMLYTDGVEYFCENAGNGAYWFLDIIGTEVHAIQRKGEEFLNIVLLVTADEQAAIKVDDGNGRELFLRTIDWTDCPAGEWQFFLENDVLCLPSER
jgi:hypothetical protein